MKFIRLIAALTALVAVSACAEMEPMERPITSTPMVTAPPPPAAPVVADDVALPPSPVVVHFNHGKADITGSTMQVLWGLAPALKAVEPGVIRVEGFTDSSGKATFNRKLAERRAAAVAEQLHKLGISAKIEVISGGAVKAGKKGVKDASARKVEISWQPAAKAKTAADQSLQTAFTHGSKAVGVSGTVAGTPHFSDVPDGNSIVLATHSLAESVKTPADAPVFRYSHLSLTLAEAKTAQNMLS